ncbi:putative metalloprotease CJM1_0395 family protein [Pelagicoccus albus]|uniref:SprA-related family protein n=1 Tax=Pelagicoccus albus TaxID=415222 RepID=A0A7X1B9D0_9BACT|nr:putative metalloprotease CJM1_0395 family protein [Pelagicoccus albus]MBC2606808.1 hypothetical protein [Pelagicoccus albus]
MIAPISSTRLSGFSTSAQTRNGSGEAENATSYEKKAEESKNEKEEFDPSNPQKLDEAEQKQVEDLKKRDAEVRAHEQAHMAAAGSLAMGGPNYVFQTGPDGKQYAIGGSVKIDTSPGKTPEESARKAQQIKAAALAPSEPSAQDLKVAASAAKLEAESEEKEDSPQDLFRKNNSSGLDASEDASGEISSIRQIFAPSSTQGEESDGQEQRRSQSSNVYMQLAAEKYSARKGLYTNG